LSFDSDQRAGGLADLRALLERHPRATWPSRGTPATQFWLGVHSGLRRDVGALTSLGQDFLDRRLRAAALAVVGGARLHALVAQLRGHHEVEDHHYFPILRESHPDLAKGFGLLEKDHEALAQEIRAALAALAELTASAHAPGSTQRAAQRAAERFVSVAESLRRRLLRHLDDEEDLVIPALLERG
jgi:hypothetical protein